MSRTPKATRGKLERALTELESFFKSDNALDVVSHYDYGKLQDAINTIQGIEGRMYAAEEDAK